MNYTLEKTTDWEAVEVNSITTQIPTAWVVKKVRQLFELRAGGDLEKETYSAVKTNICNWPIYSNSVSDRGLYGYGISPKFAADTITVTARGTLGVAFYRSEPYTAIGRLLVMTKKENMSVLFFEYVINCTVDIAMEQTSIPQLTAPSFNCYDFVVPPLLEQTHIANILSDQEALIANYDALVEQHQKRFSYLSDELLSGRLRLEDSGTDGLRVVKNEDWEEVEVNGELLSSPTDWKVIKMHETNCSISTGRLNANAAVENGLYDFYTCGKKTLKTNEFAFESTGALVLNGNGDVGEVKLATGKFAVYQRNYVITGLECTLFSYFLFSYTYKKLLTVSGSAMPYIKLNDVTDFQFLRPPLQEQTHIANILSEQEEIIANYKNIRDEEQKRFEWLSNALLSGEYRVKIGG